MSEETFVPEGGIAIVPPSDTGAEISVADAARAYTAAVTKPKKEEQSAERAEPATAEHESPVEGDADPVTDPGEDEGAEPAEPAIDRPKSWSKDEDAEWQSLPRNMQQKIVARELERDNGTTRSQQEAANARKAAEAERTSAEQARQLFESKTKAALDVLEREQLRDFPDIRTLDDVAKMAMEDPFRKIQWDVHQQRMQQAAYDAQLADQRKAQEHQTNWAKFVQTESSAFAESVPEYKAKKADYDTKAAAILREIGFTDDELNKLASGEEKIPLFDRRIQRLLFDRIKLSEIQSAPKAVVKPGLPLVQRPGTSKPAGSTVSAEIQTLTRQLNETGDIRTATRLYELEQRAARRAS